jgi:hypothetical protein
MALATAIAAAATLGGAVLSGSNQNKAASKAADATQRAADASAAVLRENYDKSAQALAPWQSSGLSANNQLNALLGLGGGQQMAGPSYGGGDPYASYVQQNPDLMAEFGRVGGQFGGDMGAYGQFHYNQFGQNEGRMLPSQQMQAAPTGGVSSQDAARAAFDQFRNSTGYQFRLGEGMDAVNSGYAGAGTLKSGAAMKAINEYGQNFASNEFANYANLLNNQAGKGLTAASAQAGVSTSLGNNLANIQMQQGENLANAAMQKTSPFGNALSAIGGSLFKLGGK